MQNTDSAASSRTTKLWQSWVLWGLVGTYAVVVLATAWLNDDCFITLRVVDNMAEGHGPRWNVSERVQVFTHPLWFMLIAVVHAVTSELYFSVLLLSVGISIGVAVLLATWNGLTFEMRALGLLALLMSTSFVDYSTSGLENPLTHLLLIGFFRFAEALRGSDRGRAGLLLLLGLIALNREDTVLLVLPAAVYFCLGMERRQLLRAALVGLSPLLAWKAFSLVYYGFFFPNTAYAKLATGVEWTDRLQLGMVYYDNQVHGDLLSCLLIVAALVTATTGRSRHVVLPAVGIALYLGYVLLIGGSFMLGRYFAAPTLLAVIALIQHPPLRAAKSAVAVAATLSVLGLTAPNPTLAFDLAFGLKGEQLATDGVSDERFIYYPGNGLLPMLLRGAREPQHYFFRMGRALRPHGGVHARAAVGMMGFAAGPGVHMVDVYALTDPLLARLPAWRGHTPPWIFRGLGHHARRLPVGYLRTLRADSNRFEDPRIAGLYGHMSLITRAPILWPMRWRAIGASLLGRGPVAPKFYATRYPTSVPLAELRIPQHHDQYSKDAIPIHADRGLRVDVGELPDATWLDIALHPVGDYRFEFSLGGRSTAVTRVRPPHSSYGVVRFLMPIPAEVLASGWDAVNITPVDRNMWASLAHLIPVHGYRLDVTLRDLAVPQRDGARWDGPGTIAIYPHSPLRVRLPGVSHRGHWDVSVDFNDTYALEFHHAGRHVGTAELNPMGNTSPGLVRRDVPVPEAAQRDGYDEIRVRLVAGDAYCAIGHLIPVVEQ